MRTKIPVGVALVLALLPAAALAQKAVFVVRHAEKAAEASDRDVPLSDEGEARARRLESLLRDAGVTSICSTDTVRTRATAEPLAHDLKATVRIYSDVAALVGEMRREPEAVVLVIGHSNTVPALIAALGVRQKIEIGDKEYDNLFLVVPRPSGEPVFLRMKY
jgi:broad specificity phosphatase PhoE